jgi:hypothetical protein
MYVRLCQLFKQRQQGWALRPRFGASSSEFFLNTFAVCGSVLGLLGLVGVSSGCVFLLVFDWSVLG